MRKVPETHDVHAKPIYLNPEDVPVCIMKKESDVKPPEECRTRYGVVDDPWEMKYLYEYFNEKFD